MKRRGFLAALGLSPVVAPAMLKDIAAQTTADLGLQNLGIGAPESSPPASAYPQPAYPVGHLRSVLELLKNRSAEQHDFFRRRTGVYGLDPDLASYRSMSLSFRVAEQQRRNYASSLENETAWHLAKLAGWPV